MNEEEIMMKNMQNEISEMKAKLDVFGTRLYQVERSSDKHDQQIISLNDQLKKIEDNTTWIKRTITGAIITAFSTAAIGGVAAIVFNVFQQ